MARPPPSMRFLGRIAFAVLLAIATAMLLPAHLLGLEGLDIPGVIWRLPLGLGLFAAVGFLAESWERERQSEMLVHRLLALKEAYDTLSQYRVARSSGQVGLQQGHPADSSREFARGFRRDSGTGESATRPGDGGSRDGPGSVRQGTNVATTVRPMPLRQETGSRSGSESGSMERVQPVGSTRPDTGREERKETAPQADPGAAKGEEKTPDIALLSRLADARLEAHRAKVAGQEEGDPEYHEGEGAEMEDTSPEGPIIEVDDRDDTGDHDVDGDDVDANDIDSHDVAPATGSTSKAGKVATAPSARSRPQHRAQGPQDANPSPASEPHPEAPSSILGGIMESGERDDFDDTLESLVGDRLGRSELKVLKHLVERLDGATEDREDDEDTGNEVLANLLDGTGSDLPADRVAVQGRMIADLVGHPTTPLRILCEPLLLDEKGKAASMTTSRRGQGNITPVIDSLLLYRALRYVRSARADGAAHETSSLPPTIFACRISQDSFSDAAFLGDLLPYLALQADKANALALIIPHAAVLERGPRTLDRLGELADSGLTFGLGDCTEPDPDLAMLGRMGFRFIETPIKRLKALQKTYGPAGLSRFARKRADTNVALCASGIRTQGDLGIATEWQAEMAYGDRFGRKMPMTELLREQWVEHA